MSIVIFISCNGKKCDTILPVNAEDVISARIEARVKGWDTTREYVTSDGRWITTDQCKNHLRPRTTGNAPADIMTRVPAETCAQGKECPALHAETPQLQDVFHWCGHDQLGHRMANILIRDGYTEVKQVTAAGVPELLDLRGFGRMCLERWQAFKKEEPGA